MPTSPFTPYFPLCQPVEYAAWPGTLSFLGSISKWTWNTLEEEERKRILECVFEQWKVQTNRPFFSQTREESNHWSIYQTKTLPRGVLSASHIPREYHELASTPASQGGALYVPITGTTLLAWRSYCLNEYQPSLVDAALDGFGTFHCLEMERLLWCKTCRNKQASHYFWVGQCGHCKRVHWSEGIDVYSLDAPPKIHAPKSAVKEVETTTDALRTLLGPIPNEDGGVRFTAEGGWIQRPSEN
jgi:hypothetical protein